MIPPVQTVYRHPPEQLGHWRGKGEGLGGSTVLNTSKLDNLNTNYGLWKTATKMEF